MIALILIVITIVIATAVATNQARPEKNKFFSAQAIKDKLLYLIERFPVSILFVMAVSVFAFISIESKNEDLIPYNIWIFCIVSAFIGVIAVLFAEDFTNYKKANFIAIVPILLWGIYAMLLPAKSSDIQVSKGIELGVIIGTAFFSMFFINYLGKNKDRSFWNFANQMLLQMLLACLFGGIFFGGLSLAVFAIDSLFNIDVNSRVYAYLSVICFLLISPIYFLANIPNKTEKYNDTIFALKIQRILALYVITPILAIYTIILYVYALKIIVAWELPNGWVSWLVSALALGGLLVVTLLYPIREQEDNKLPNSITRLIILLIMPLLTLMTVGILRRISDYGITINRGYILILNIWFYGIYVYLFLTKSRRIKWILISPLAIALLVSINIWGIAHITKKKLTNEISTVIPKPISFTDAKSIFAKMDNAQRERMQSVLRYTHKHFGKESVQPFFTDTVDNDNDGWGFISDIGLRMIDLGNEYKGINYHNRYENKSIAINSYKHFEYIEYEWYSNNDSIMKYNANNGILKINMPNDTLKIEVKETVWEMLKTDEDDRDKKEFIIKKDNYKLIITYLSGNYYSDNDSLDFRGLNAYLFYNNKN